MPLKFYKKSIFLTLAFVFSCHANPLFTIDNLFLEINKHPLTRQGNVFSNGSYRLTVEHFSAAESSLELTILSLFEGQEIRETLHPELANPLEGVSIELPPYDSAQQTPAEFIEMLNDTSETGPVISKWEVFCDYGARWHIKGGFSCKSPYTYVEAPLKYDRQNHETLRYVKFFIPGLERYSQPQRFERIPHRKDTNTPAVPLPAKYYVTQSKQLRPVSRVTYLDHEGTPYKVLVPGPDPSGILKGPVQNDVLGQYVTPVLSSEEIIPSSVIYVDGPHLYIAPTAVMKYLICIEDGSELIPIPIAEFECESLWPTMISFELPLLTKHLEGKFSRGFYQLTHHTKDSDGVVKETWESMETNPETVLKSKEHRDRVFNKDLLPGPVDLTNAFKKDDGPSIQSLLQFQFQGECLIGCISINMKALSCTQQVQATQFILDLWRSDYNPAHSITGGLYFDELTADDFRTYQERGAYEGFHANTFNISSAEEIASLAASGSPHTIDELILEGEALTKNFDDISALFETNKIKALQFKAQTLKVQGPKHAKALAISKNCTVAHLILESDNPSSYFKDIVTFVQKNKVSKMTFNGTHVAAKDLGNLMDAKDLNRIEPLQIGSGSTEYFSQQGLSANGREARSITDEQMEALFYKSYSLETLTFNYPFESSYSYLSDTYAERFFKLLSQSLWSLKKLDIVGTQFSAKQWDRLAAMMPSLINLEIFKMHHVEHVSNQQLITIAKGLSKLPKLKSLEFQMPSITTNFSDVFTLNYPDLEDVPTWGKVIISSALTPLLMLGGGLNNQGNDFNYVCDIFDATSPVNSFKLYTYYELGELGKNLIFKSHLKKNASKVTFIHSTAPIKPKQD